LFLTAAGKGGERHIAEVRVGRWAVLLLRLVLAATFVYAGAVKLAEPARFAVDVNNYHLLPWAVGVRLAFYVPWVEILCGLAVLFWRLQPGALVILIGLLCVFIMASVSAKIRGIDITCGCFGTAGQNLGFARHLLIDFALLGATALLFWRHRSSTSYA
jgi:putative oxidoreductase